MQSLINCVKEWYPDIDVPSEEWVQLQFTPLNHDVNASLIHVLEYLKEFWVLYCKNTKLLFVDEKAAIPFDVPENAVSTNKHWHKKSPAPASGPTLGAMDYNWKIAGLVASVVLHYEKPESSSESFYHALKQKSAFFSHCLHSDTLHSSKVNCVTEHPCLRKFSLYIVTVGGSKCSPPMHQCKYLLSLFLHGNVDMLIAICTCPTQSWVIPGKHMLPLLNLALQTVVLERSPMPMTLNLLLKKKNHQWQRYKLWQNKTSFFKKSVSSLCNQWSARSMINLKEWPWRKWMLSQNQPHQKLISMQNAI